MDLARPSPFLRQNFASLVDQSVYFRMPQAVSIVNFNEGSNRAYTLNVKALENILGDRAIANKKVNHTLHYRNICY